MIDERVQKVFYAVGIIASVYVVLRYVLPAVLKMLGIVIGAVFHTLLWIIIILIAAVSVLYIVEQFKKR